MSKLDILKTKITQPYSIEDKNYLNNLHKNIIKKIKLIENDDLKINKNNFIIKQAKIKLPYKEPKLYFDKFSKNLISLIKTNKIEEKISKTNIKQEYKFKILNPKISLPYTVPENYWNENVDNQIKITKKILNFNNNSSNKKIKLPYNINNNYFKNLSKDIIKNINKDNSNSKIFFIFNKINRNISIAASILILITSGIFIYNKTNINYYSNIEPMTESQVLTELNKLDKKDLDYHLTNYEQNLSNDYETEINEINADDFYKSSMDNFVNTTSLNNIDKELILNDNY